jgi:tetratricopeptide (TPR) repeat protein
MSEINSARLSRSDHIEVKNKVLFYLGMQRYDAAEKLLKATLTEFQKNAALFNLLGLTYHKQSKFPEAIKQFKTALQINPNYIEAALNLVGTLCDVSKYEEAREVYGSLSATMNEQLKIPNLIVGRLANQHAENGRVYDQAGLFDRAIAEYKKALDLFPKLADVRFELARLYLQEGILDKARSELESLIAVYPDMNKALNLLGVIYFKAGRQDLAKTAWSRSAQSNPDDATSRILMRATETWSA